MYSGDQPRGGVQDGLQSSVDAVRDVLVMLLLLRMTMMMMTMMMMMMMMMLLVLMTPVVVVAEMTLPWSDV